MSLIQHLKNLNAAVDTGRFEEALLGYRTLLEKEPKNASIWVEIGIAYRKAKQPDAAIAAYTEALRLRPDLSAAMNTNIGNIFLDQKQYDNAITHYQKTLSEKPHNITAHLNWGHALWGKKQWQLAQQQYQHVIEFEPTQADAHFHLSLCYLMQRDYIAGFTEYEWRWRRPSVSHQQHKITLPQWSGESLNGKTLFVHCEQGFGDILQFARFMPYLKNTGGHIIMECPDPLFRLFQSLKNVDQLFSRQSALPHFDCHIPLLSLPYVLKTTYETLPRQIPYLSPDKITQQQWQEHCRVFNNNMNDKITNIGFVWAGSLDNPHTFRSTSLEDFAPLFHLPNTRWFNLQIDARKTALKHYPMVIDLTEHIRDFADTAALIMQCDLIITIDTAVAHLTGSLGVPCWVLLADPPDWRWGESEIHSHWYPNTHLFHQTTRANWSTVFENIKNKLNHKII